MHPLHFCGGNRAKDILHKWLTQRKNMCVPEDVLCVQIYMQPIDKEGWISRLEPQSSLEKLQRDKHQHDILFTSNPLTSQSSPAEEMAALCSEYHQSWPSSSQLYCRTKGNSQYKAVTRHADSSKQALTALFKVRLFGAIKPRTKQI